MIKTFENFNSESEDDKLKETIEDILIYLRDDGYPIDVKVVQDYKKHIFIGILNYHNNEPVMWSVISNDIFRIIEVLKGKFSPDKVYYNFYETGRFTSQYRRETQDWAGFKILNNGTNEKKLTYFSMEFEEE